MKFKKGDRVYVRAITAMSSLPQGLGTVELAWESIPGCDVLLDRTAVLDDGTEADWEGTWFIRHKDLRAIHEVPEADRSRVDAGPRTL